MSSEPLGNLPQSSTFLRKPFDGLGVDKSTGSTTFHQNEIAPKIIQNRFLVFILGAIILITIILALYFNLRGR
ncbi:unnamed protein product [Boreogadus saida]